MKVSLGAGQEGSPFPPSAGPTSTGGELFADLAPLSEVDNRWLRIEVDGVRLAGWKGDKKEEG